MSNKLKFLCWPIAGAPMLMVSGAESDFSDGVTIELFSDAKTYVEAEGLSFADVQFKMTMEHNGQELASHSFQMETMTGANIWLIANPALTKPNGSFTGAFVNALCELGAGDHLVSIKLFAEHNGGSVCINDGEITFKHDGTNAEYQALMPSFGDMDAVRNQANQATQKAYEDKREQEAAEKHAARYYKINLDNTNESKTIYVIRKDHKTLSENILEVQPNRSITTELSRNMTFDLLFYRQDQNKDSAIKFATVSESFEGQTFQLF